MWNWNTHFRVWRRLLPCALGLTLLMQVRHVSRGAEDDHLLEYLLLQNEASRQKISSVTYKQTWEQKVEDQGRTRTTLGQASVKVLGTKFKDNWIFAENETRSAPLGPREAPLFKVNVVVNDRYVGILHKMPQGMSVFQHMHDSIEHKPTQGEIELTLCGPPDALGFGFGFGGSDLRGQIRGSKRVEGSKWEAAEIQDPEGKHLFEIRYYDPSVIDGSRPFQTFKLDPARGFLITETNSYNSGGELYIGSHVSVSEIQPGIWFPIEIDETMDGVTLYAKTNTGARKSHTRTRLENIAVNVPLSKEEFELEALGYSKDTMKVLRFMPSGEKLSLTYLHGELVPVNLKRDIERLAMTGARSTVEIPGGEHRPSETQSEPTEQPAAVSPSDGGRGLRMIGYAIGAGIAFTIVLIGLVKRRSASHRPTT